MVLTQEVIFQSKYQINDKVVLDFGHVKVPDCIVYAIKFTQGKVKYDIEILIDKNWESYYTIIRDVDSNFVTNFVTTNN